MRQGEIFSFQPNFVKIVFIYFMAFASKNQMISHIVDKLIVFLKMDPGFHRGDGARVEWRRDGSDRHFNERQNPDLQI